jgi:hypothetical protein
MSGWPDPEKPGVPLNPERDGIHWLFNPDNDKPHPVIWVADLGTWAVGDVWTPRIVAEMGLHYLGPVLMPAEADALRAENARLREALTWFVENDDTNEGDTPMPEHGGRSWNEINAYWIEGLNAARAALENNNESV